MAACAQPQAMPAKRAVGGSTSSPHSENAAKRSRVSLHQASHCKGARDCGEEDEDGNDDDDDEVEEVESKGATGGDDGAELPEGTGRAAEEEDAGAAAGGSQDVDCGLVFTRAHQAAEAGFVCGAGKAARVYQSEAVAKLISLMWIDQHAAQTRPVNYLVQHATGTGKSVNFDAHILLCQIHKCVGSRVQMCLVAYKFAVSRIQLRCGDQMNAPWHMYEQVITYLGRPHYRRPGSRSAHLHEERQIHGCNREEWCLGREGRGDRRGGRRGWGK